MTYQTCAIYKGTLSNPILLSYKQREPIKAKARRQSTHPFDVTASFGRDRRGRAWGKFKVMIQTC